MIPKGWKIKVGIEDERCDVFYEPFEEYGLPFIPRVGEILWTSERYDSILKSKVDECYGENKCPDCPFKDSGIAGYVYVSEVKYDVDKKEVTIIQSNETNN